MQIFTVQNVQPLILMAAHRLERMADDPKMVKCGWMTCELGAPCDEASKRL